MAAAKGNEAVAGGGGGRGRRRPVRRPLLRGPQPRRGGDDRSVRPKPGPGLGTPGGSSLGPRCRPSGPRGGLQRAQGRPQPRGACWGARGAEGPVPAAGPGGRGCRRRNCQCCCAPAGGLGRRGTRAGPGAGGRAPRSRAGPGPSRGRAARSRGLAGLGEKCSDGVRGRLGFRA